MGFQMTEWVKKEFEDIQDGEMPGKLSRYLRSREDLLICG